MRGSLTGTARFRRVYAEGRRAHRGPIVAIVRAGDEPTAPTQVGLAVRCRAGAVVRNRIRRRLRAAIGSSVPATGFEVVVKGDERVAGMRFQELERFVREAVTATGPGEPR